MNKTYLFLANKGAFFWFCPNVDKPIFSVMEKTGKKAGGKTTLEKTANPGIEYIQGHGNLWGFPTNVCVENMLLQDQNSQTTHY